MKGILFRTWKAAAIRLAGTDRPWQTRRALRPQPLPDAIAPEAGTTPHLANRLYLVAIGPVRCWKPRYFVGETVYIKERHRFHWADDSSDGQAEYSDGSTDDILDLGHKWRNSKWRSPMFMPEFAARTFITITGVRVARTADISVEDCLAEGIREWPEWNTYERIYQWRNSKSSPERRAYAALYDSINGAGAHETNWDWVYEFRLKEAK